ncbi:glycosyltransferase family 31 protein [Dothidotthia symphoricarpi CBS 119687]|uniref:N-acetylgalactosaminide beta-1,3-galactosyltransferase n=1 Tax=Dothidotthia symphoricarpi CBS 119687 TaxID=1392245 RepID=A0A6A6A9P2_9PLEO|nr:glycosyltransferase family 31 protein [Dothidotthia symphoricarpi CBS 119687]KAF2127895.1 glycosyltransferase family 31 protein [Dothidotthia symphoricarpi CBS 119687]
MPHPAFVCRVLLMVVFSVSVINLLTSIGAPSLFLSYAKPASSHSKEEVLCPQSQLADDVLVILRTGATESREKVPVHFRTTLRCVPNFAVFSDWDEEIEGHQVEDVLGGVSQETRDSNEDFKLHRHLQEHGRDGLQSQKVITALSGSSKGDYLQTDKEGWKLDKWKFLPMIDRAFEKKKDAKWYVFIEADTYLAWNNLLAYLATFDDTKPYYIGKHLYINGVEFGYGGAGFVLSQPAMRKVIAQRSPRIHEYEDFTKTHWVGDCALGKVLADSKIPLHRGFPHFQGDSPATLDPATVKINRDLWCFPLVTAHHMSTPEIEALWRFEQDWLAQHGPDVLLRHRDVFTDLIRPQIAPELPFWDNLSADKEYNAHDHAVSADAFERSAWKSFEHCRALCDSQPRCVQFSFDAGSCAVSGAFRMGFKRPGERVRSGWMLDRVDGLFGGLEDRCGVRDWFGPEDEGGNRAEAKMRRRRGV